MLITCGAWLQKRVDNVIWFRIRPHDGASLEIFLTVLIEHKIILTLKFILLYCSLHFDLLYVSQILSSMLFQVSSWVFQKVK